MPSDAHDATDGALPPPSRLPAPTRLPAPIGAAAPVVRAWFDAAADAIHPILDGTLAAEHDAADVFRRLAKADNTRIAYRAAVRAWCDWCARRGVSPLPAAGENVAAFLASERRRGLAAGTIDLRRAAIRYLHRAAGCAVPTDDACVSETVAGIRRDAAARGELPGKKVAATATIIRQMLAVMPDDLYGLRDRALLLVGFAGALRRSELCAIQATTWKRPRRAFA